MLWPALILRIGLVMISLKSINVKRAHSFVVSNPGLNEEKNVLPMSHTADKLVLAFHG